MDGSQIIFMSSIGNHPTQNIFVMRPDGEEITQLTFSKSGYGSGFPTPSPDGRNIAFVSEDDGNREVNIMDIDGSNRRRLTNHPAWDGERVGWVGLRRLPRTEEPDTKDTATRLFSMRLSSAASFRDHAHAITRL